MVTQTTTGRELNTLQLNRPSPCRAVAVQDPSCRLMIQIRASLVLQGEHPCVHVCTHTRVYKQQLCNALWPSQPTAALRPGSQQMEGFLQPPCLVQQAILDTLIKYTSVGTGSEQVTDVNNVISSMRGCSWFLQAMTRTKRNHLKADTNSSMLVSPFLLSAPICCFLPLAIEAIM